MTLISGIWTKTTLNIKGVFTSSKSERESDIDSNEYKCNQSQVNFTWDMDTFLSKIVFVFAFTRCEWTFRVMDTNDDASSC